MGSEWKWDRLDPFEREVAGLLVEGKSNAAICSEVFLSRARVQECIKRIQIKTETDSTRAAIALLVEEREAQTLTRILDEAAAGVVIVQDRVVQFANRALHRIHGYDPYEMHGVPVIELIAPRSTDLVSHQHEVRLKGEPFSQSYGFRLLCKGGEEKDAVVATAGVIRYRGKPALIGLVTPHSSEERIAGEGPNV